ncbi:MAG: glycoside hydrolase family 2 TIM barrel-domain containing protein [Anaerolineae bacterium]
MESSQQFLPVTAPTLSIEPYLPPAHTAGDSPTQSSELSGARIRLSLDGTWHFQFDPSDCAEVKDITDWRETHVPMPWQAEFEDLREEAGTAWYRRIFDIPPDWPQRSTVLHFGAVDYYAQVWLNNVFLGEHAGGYLPFEFQVDQHLNRAGANELVVRVTGPIDDPQRYPNFAFSEIPHGKQSWYGPLHGIWQSVWLENRVSCHISVLRIQSDLSTGAVQVGFTLASPAEEDAQAVLQIVDPSGDTVASTRLSLPASYESALLTATVANPMAWSPDDPRLYQLQVGLVQAEIQVDFLAQHFGFRTIETREGRLYLNGEPIYLRGALDQDYYPDTIATPPSTAFLEDQLRKAKELGLNCLRCHIKVADPRYYEVADRLGMLIWTELPNWRLLTEGAAQRGRVTLEGILERDGHHPSIIIWTIINEDWGTDLVHNATHRAWLKTTYHWLKEQDPTRLVVDNSACWPNFHVQTDLEDYHHYRAIPDHRRKWDDFVNAFAGRSNWTFSPYGDAVRTGYEPLIVSEFGNWGLPDVNLLLNDGKEPWWFETGQEWDDGVVHPHGVRRRFRAWYLDRVFGTWQAFIEATQWQQYLALKYEIESMRRRPEIAGYVITEFTDVHWEANGLLDIKRNPKVYYYDFAAINANTVIVPEWERLAYWAGGVNPGLAVAHVISSYLFSCGNSLEFESGEAQGRWFSCRCCRTGTADPTLTLPPLRWLSGDVPA